MFVVDMDTTRRRKLKRKDSHSEVAYSALKTDAHSGVSQSALRLMLILESHSLP